MTCIDDRIRHAYGPTPVEESHRERIWAGALGSRTTWRNRSRWRAPRTLIAVVVALVSIGSIAVAQPGSMDNIIGGKDHDERLSVLKEPDPIGTTGLSETAKDMFGFRHSEAPQGGFSSIDPDDLHKVLDHDAGRYSFKLRSGASADGQACLYTEIHDDRRNMGHSAAGSCSLSFEYNGHVTVGAQRDIRLGTVVTGLADDDVEQVRVKLSDGTAAPAIMGNNGYLLHLKKPKLRTRGLLVDLKDGRTLDVAMSGCLRSQVTAQSKSRLGCGYGMNKAPERELR